MSRDSSEGKHDDPHGWRQEGRDLLAAVAGGVIVGMPLLYTMEMWWHGMTVSEWHQLALLTAILLVNFGFSIVSGFRQEWSIPQALMETVTSVGIGIVLSAVILALIGEMKPGHTFSEISGKVLLEAAAVSIGVSFANVQVRDRSRTGDDEQKPRPPDGDPEVRQLHADLRDATAAMIGSTLFALNIAPTEEVVLIASRLGAWQLLAVLGASLVFCYVILFASRFEEHEVYVPGVFQSPVAETVMTCALSLAVAFVLLWLLGEAGTLSEPRAAIANTVALGLPACVGGAAGRLVA